MLAVEEYILQMKKKDKLDEFDFRNHAENMTKVIGYVMNYFNNYLDPEAYDYENIKAEQTIIKIRNEIEEDFPKSQEFIIQYYQETKSRIDRTFKKWLEAQEYLDLYFSYEDYEKAASEFCSSGKMRNTGIAQYKDKLSTLASEIKRKHTEIISVSDYKFLDNRLVTWIQDTYREYGVNLYQFAQAISWEYYEKYVEYIHSNHTRESYHINNYNHRYNNNPFGIDNIYKENKHRPFIDGRKYELEMLIMHDWVFYSVKDTDYWPEYVNLCVSAGRVGLASYVNILLPVISKGLAYPSDISGSLVFTETTDGLLKTNPSGQYVLRLGYSNDSDIIWKEPQAMNALISNLNDMFTKHGEPYALEILSPFRTQAFGLEEFFAQYRQFEKGMKKYSNMKIALINGLQAGKNKPTHIMESIEDIIKIRNLARDMRLKLKLAIDFSKLLKRKSTSRYGLQEIFNPLAEIRNSIIGIHLPGSVTKPFIHETIIKDDKTFLNKFDYPQNSDFLGGLSALLYDNQIRYFVPEQIKNNEELEELIDDLLRGGFSFSSPEVKDED